MSFSQRSLSWSVTLLTGLMLSTASLAGCASQPKTPEAPAVVAEPINEASLTSYLSTRFAPGIEKGIVLANFGSGNVAEEVITELKMIGIADTAQLHAIIPENFEEKGYPAIAGDGSGSTTFAGLLRDLMLIHDAARYARDAWHHQYGASRGDFPLPNAYGVTDDRLLELTIIGGGDSTGGGGYGGLTYGGE